LAMDICRPVPLRPLPMSLPLSDLSHAQQLATLLGEAHRSGVPLAQVPPEATVTTRDEALAVQDLLAPSFGEVIGWKVGRRVGSAPATRAPLFSSLRYDSGASLPRDAFHLWMVEAELMFRLRPDLPKGAMITTRADVLDALDRVRPVFEIVDSRYGAYPKVDPLLTLADGQSHGAMVFGPDVPFQAGFDYENPHFRLLIDGHATHDQHGGNPGGDPITVILHAIEDGLAVTPGHWITTGSFNGMPVLSPGSTAEAHFDGVGSVSVSREA